MAFSDPLTVRGTAVTSEGVSAMDKALMEDASTRAMASVVPHVPFGDVVTRTETLGGEPHLFSRKVSPDVSVTSQHSTGRCWIFAACNVARFAMMKKFGLPKSFELSQAHVFYWDKIERANWFLNCVWQESPSGIDSRTMQHLVAKPTEDGGQWDMLVAVIEKHGLMPKPCFPDLVHGRASGSMNGALNLKLREFASRLVDLRGDGGDDAAAASMIGGMMTAVHRVVATALGTPPATIDYEYEADGGKGLRAVRGATPLAFYRDLVKPCFDFAAHVSVVHDPRAEHAPGSVMTVALLGNVVGSAHAVRYVNAPISTLKRLVVDSVAANVPVWFGCDVGKSLHRDRGVLSLTTYDFAGVLGASSCMDKATRLRYGHSLMTHAMVFSGFHAPDEAKPMADLLAADDDAAAAASPTDDAAAPAPAPEAVSRFRVDNSWGAKGEGAGRLSMTSDWFDQYVYQVVVHRDRLPAELREALDSGAEPIVLPPWDPMGALAQ